MRQNEPRPLAPIKDDRMFTCTTKYVISPVVDAGLGDLKVLDRIVAHAPHVVLPQRIPHKARVIRVRPAVQTIRVGEVEVMPQLVNHDGRIPVVFLHEQAQPVVDVRVRGEATRRPDLVAVFHHVNHVIERAGKAEAQLCLDRHGRCVADAVLGALVETDVDVDLQHSRRRDRQRAALIVRDGEFSEGARLESACRGYCVRLRAKEFVGDVLGAVGRR